VWHSVLGTALLYGAACIHLALAFESLYGRRTLRMAPLDLIRIMLGLGIPTLLIGHAVGTRVAWELYGQSPQYSRVVWSLWMTESQGWQLALLLPGWLHGCLGIHLAFSSRPLYQRLHRLLFAAALLLPVLGGLGFLAMGKELAADFSNRGPLDAGLDLPFGAGAALRSLRETLLVAYFSACAAVFLARATVPGSSAVPMCWSVSSTRNARFACRADGPCSKPAAVITCRTCRSVAGEHAVPHVACV
jgi:adenylate cyclase